MEPWIKEQWEKLEKQRIDIPLRYAQESGNFYKRSLDFNYQFVVFASLIAGFGFTAISNIQSKPLFIIAELVLLTVSALILFRTKRITEVEQAALSQAITEQVDLFKKLRELLQSAIDEKKLTENEYKKKREDLAVAVFKNEGDKSRTEILPKSYIIWFIIGVLLLLSSFFIKTSFTFCASPNLTQRGSNNGGLLLKDRCSLKKIHIHHWE